VHVTLVGEPVPSAVAVAMTHTATGTAAAKRSSLIVILPLKSLDVPAAAAYRVSMADTGLDARPDLTACLSFLTAQLTS
jgi:hypothetical protein